MAFHTPEIRAVHFDMKSMIATPGYALELADMFAEQNFNAILIEFEDKFPFDAFPENTHPCAWSKAEFRRFADRCNANGIEVIPLLQSIGHLDYFLKHDKFRCYREGGEQGTSYQWCLSNPETFEVWKVMAEEILATFPECRYFHLGADECKFTHPCARCEGRDKFADYTARVEACADFAIAHGKKPVIWDDVFRKHEIEGRESLLSKVIPCVWQYRDINPEFIERMLRYTDQVWGASCCQAHRRYFANAPQEPKLCNIDLWGEMHEKYHLTGHVGTIWGRIQCQTPYDATTPQSLYATGFLGETLMHGKITDRAAFNARFAEKFFGAPGFDLCELIGNLFYEPELATEQAADLYEKATRNRSIAKVWQLFSTIDEKLAYVDMCFDNNRAMLPLLEQGMIPEEQLLNWLDGCRRIAEEIPAAMEEVKKELTAFFPEPVLQEFFDQRFASRYRENQTWKAILQKSQRERKI